ncbi:hypothetical protein TcCL_Unassigned00971 [Trypanosoma cruzi]|nr:hypothetical protein TcCL_Unassigned00971 [Trypanosoma cruzi]
MCLPGRRMHDVWFRHPQCVFPPANNQNDSHGAAPLKESNRGRHGREPEIILKIIRRNNSSKPLNRAVLIPLLLHWNLLNRKNATGTCAAQYLSLSRVPSYFSCVPRRWRLRYTWDDSKISSTMLRRADT